MSLGKICINPLRRAGASAQKSTCHRLCACTPAHRLSNSSRVLGRLMVMFGVVRATGAVFPPLVVLTVALLGVRFPLAYFLLGTWGADAIWWSFPISASVAVVLSFLYYKYGHWRTLRIAPIPHRNPPIPAASAPAE